jgi:hypothetical protein
VRTPADFDGAFQAGMCTGAILSAKLSDLRPLAMAPGPNFVQPAGTVRPVSWGYRNPFGIRFAPDGNPLDGALFVSENGEDERGARPTNNAPDRLQLVAKEIVKHGLDYHGWPDRFGFLDSTQAIFNPIGGPADDCASCAAGRPVRPLLRFPPQPPVAPLGIEPTDVAAVGLDFVPKRFAGAGNPGDIVQKGDVLVTREGDFGFSPGNGTPIIGHDIERVSFPTDGTISLERFVFNCKKELQKDVDGRKRCELPPGNATGSNQAFVDHLRGINRPVDGKFGPDGAFYLVDFGAVRDFGRSTNGPPVSVESSMFRNPADQPLVQIPATGVIWKISRIGGERGRDKDDKD